MSIIAIAFLLGAFHPPHGLNFDAIRIDELAQCCTWLALSHGVCGIAIVFDPFDFGDLPALIRPWDAYAHRDGNLISASSLEKTCAEAYPHRLQ